MDLRPQGHDIIRTWLFSTVVRAHYEYDSLPWRHAATQRLDPRPGPQEDEQVQGQRRRRRMDLLQEHGTDAVRYWAATGRPGTDTAFDTGADEGRPPARHQGAQRQPVRAGLRRRRRASTGPRRSSPSRSTGPCWPASARWWTWRPTANEALDYTRALEVTETFFWAFCDDYLELVKDRAYGGQGDEGAADRRFRASGAAPRPRHPAAPAGTRSRVRDRGGLVVVPRRRASRFDPSGTLADDGRARRRPRAPTRRSSRRSARRSPASARRSPTPRSVCARRSPA